MKHNDVFVVNGNIDRDLIQLELTENMVMIESMLIVLKSVLYEVIICEHELKFVKALLNHLNLTMKLFRKIYLDHPHDKSDESVFSLNASLAHEVLHNELVASTHQLQSLCYFAAYEILGSLDSHTVNSLVMVNKYAERAVYLIDMMALQKG